MDSSKVAANLQVLLDLGEEESKVLAEVLLGDLKKRAKTDFFTAIRVYKNRLSLLCDFLYEDIGDFDLLFYKKMQGWHIGERTAFKDLLQTYTAKAYRLGVLAAKKDLQGRDFSSKVLEEEDGIQGKKRSRPQRDKD